jgi:hypothetical protein
MTEVLMKQCLIALLRRHLLHGGDTSPLFAALHDRRLAKAVLTILENPAVAHTVESLAACAGMSRASFSDRFAQVFLQSPMDFVQKERRRSRGAGAGSDRGWGNSAYRSGQPVSGAGVSRARRAPGVRTSKESARVSSLRERNSPHGMQLSGVVPSGAMDRSPPSSTSRIKSWLPSRLWRWRPFRSAP